MGYTDRATAKNTRLGTKGPLKANIKAAGAIKPQGSLKGGAAAKGGASAGRKK
jgi:hypothetical protein